MMAQILICRTRARAGSFQTKFHIHVPTLSCVCLIKNNRPLKGAKVIILLQKCKGAGRHQQQICCSPLAYLLHCQAERRQVVRGPNGICVKPTANGNVAETVSARWPGWRPCKLCKTALCQHLTFAKKGDVLDHRQELQCKRRHANENSV